MNRTIKYISAILLLSSVGCMKAVKDDPVYPGGPLQMTFPAPVVGPASKAVAGPIGATYDTNETFGVYGLYYPSGNFSSWKTTAAGDASYPKGSSIYINGVEFAHNPAINDTTLIHEKGVGNIVAITRNVHTLLYMIYPKPITFVLT